MTDNDDDDDDDNDNDDDDFFDLKPLNTSKRALNTNPPFFGTPCMSSVLNYADIYIYFKSALKSITHGSRWMLDDF